MDKPIYKSKAMWSGFLLIIVAMYTMATNGQVDPSALTALFTGTGIMGVRDAQDY